MADERSPSGLFENDDMKTRKIIWWKLIVFTLLTIFLIYSTKELCKMVKWSHGDMIVNWRNVPERLYEAIYMFFGDLQFLILSASLLVISICGMVHTLILPEGSGRISCFMARRGSTVTIIFTILLLLFILLSVAVLVRIRNTVEIDEFPAARDDRILFGWLCIGAELTAELAVLSLVSWKRSRP